jgi:hypothetical protein
MGTAQSQERKATEHHTPQQLHQHVANYHEQAALHHQEAAMAHGVGDGIGADLHAKTARGHAVHAAMHWIDPHSLPETAGTLTKMLFNVHGDVDGFLLDGEHQVHFPPHLSTGLLKAVKVGEKIKVHGVKLRDVALLVAVSITAENGTVIVDHGPEPIKH